MGEEYYTHVQDIKGNPTCSGSFTDFSNSSGHAIRPLWGHGGTHPPHTAPRGLYRSGGVSDGVVRPDENATPSCSGAIVLNQCVHAFQNQIRNLTTQSAAACCTACSTEPTCVQYNWNHVSNNSELSGLCSLKSALSAPNPGKVCSQVINLLVHEIVMPATHYSQNPPPPLKPYHSSSPTTPHFHSRAHSCANARVLPPLVAYDQVNCDSGNRSNTPTGPQEEDYSAFIFTKEAQRILVEHAATAKDDPFFFYLPFQSVHAPYEAPDRFVALYSDTSSPHYIEDPERRVHQGMVSALDEAVGNITRTMKTLGFTNTVIWFTSDNGGPLPTANNFPLRGGCVCALLLARTSQLIDPVESRYTSR